MARLRQRGPTPPSGGQADPRALADASTDLDVRADLDRPNLTCPRLAGPPDEALAKLTRLRLRQARPPGSQTSHWPERATLEAGLGGLAWRPDDVCLSSPNCRGGRRPRRRKHASPSSPILRLPAVVMAWAFEHAMHERRGATPLASSADVSRLFDASASMATDASVVSLTTNPHKQFADRHRSPANACRWTRCPGALCWPRGLPGASPPPPRPSQEALTVAGRPRPACACSLLLDCDRRRRHAAMSASPGDPLGPAGRSSTRSPQSLGSVESPGLPVGYKGRADPRPKLDCPSFPLHSSILDYPLIASNEIDMLFKFTLPLIAFASIALAAPAPGSNGQGNGSQGNGSQGNGSQGNGSQGNGSQGNGQGNGGGKLEGTRGFESPGAAGTCVAEAQGRRLLDRATFSSDSMTYAACAEFAVAQGFDAFGVE